MILRMRAILGDGRRPPSHVSVRVFVGPDADHLACAGSLSFRCAEWSVLRAQLGREVALDAPLRGDGTPVETLILSAIELPGHRPADRDP